MGMQPPTEPLIGLTGQISWPLGLKTLPLTLYDYQGHMSKTIMAKFMVIRAPSPDNIVLGRPGIIQLDASLPLCMPS